MSRGREHGTRVREQRRRFVAPPALGVLQDEATKADAKSGLPMFGQQFAD